MKRAAFALRCLVVAEACTLLASIAFLILRERAFALLEEGASEEVIATLELLGGVQQLVNAGTGVLFVVGTALLAAALSGRGRSLALGALAAASVRLLGLGAMWLVFSGAAPSVLQEALWIAYDVAYAAALVLSVAAAVPLRKKVAAAVLTLLVLSLGSLALGVVSIVGEPQRWWEWPARILAYGQHLTFMGGALAAASVAARAVEPAPAAGGPVSGAPLQLLATGLLIRVGVAVLSGALLAVSITQGAGALGAVCVGAAGLIGAAIVATALARYLALPDGARHGGAVVVALSMLGIGAVLDLAATFVTWELSSLVAGARGATSFWSMPSISRIEELQSSMTWLGVASQIVALVGGVSIVVSLRETAAYVKDPGAVEQASVLFGLLATASAAGVGLTLLREAGTRSVGLLLAAGAGALVLGIAMLVVWIRLLWRLASDLDEHAPAPD